MKKSNPAKQKKTIIVLAILLIITLAVAYSNKDESPDAEGDFDVNGSESAEVLSDIVSDGIAEKVNIVRHDRG